MEDKAVHDAMLGRSWEHCAVLVVVEREVNRGRGAWRSAPTKTNSIARGTIWQFGLALCCFRQYGQVPYYLSPAVPLCSEARIHG